MNMRTCRISLPVVALLLGGVSAASASTFSYSSYSVKNGQSISITKPNSISGSAGEIELIGSGANKGQDILAWCLDIYDYLKGSGSYQIGQLTTAGTGGKNPTLTTTQIGEIGALIEHGDALIAAPGAAYNVSAAIQLAIWEVEYGTTGPSKFTYSGLSSGSPSSSTLAAGYVLDVQNGTWGLVPAADVYLLSASGNQDLAYVVTPLPSTWTLMLIGLASLGFFAYRGTKDRSPAFAVA
jgi:hypothetical protein